MRILQGYADPDILLYEGVYYLYATSYHTDYGYEVYTSTDLIHWENRGDCLPSKQENALPAGLDKWFWAPDVKEHGGVFYMLASINEHLCLLTAASPLGPFLPTGTLLLEKTIDGHIAFEGEEMTIFYVSWREGHRYGLWGCRMEQDFMTPCAKTETLLLTASEPYECDRNPVLEAPYLLKREGRYYMTYSGSDYQSPYYCIAYATADSILGPYHRYAGNPILVGDGKTISGVGHHCITQAKDGSLALVYHAHRAPGQIHPRDLYLGGISFVRESGETVLRATLAPEGER